MLPTTWPCAGPSRWTVPGSSPAPIERRGQTFEQEPAGAGEAWIDYFDQLPASFRSSSLTAFPAFVRGFVHAPDAGAYIDRWVRGMQAIDAQCEMESPSFLPVS